MHKIALIGFGVVGQGLVENLFAARHRISEQAGTTFSIVAVSDFVRGSVYDPDGLDAEELLAAARDNRSLEECRAVERGWDSLTTIAKCGAETVVEVTFTDVKTGEPAISHCRAALSSGMNVVTTNKGPVALAYRELSDLAAEHGAQFRFEGAVMSGTPVLNTALTSLAGCRVESARARVLGQF